MRFRKTSLLALATLRMNVTLEIKVTNVKRAVISKMKIDSSVPALHSQIISTIQFSLHSRNCYSFHTFAINLSCFIQSLGNDQVRSPADLLSGRNSSAHRGQLKKERIKPPELQQRRKIFSTSLLLPRSRCLTGEVQIQK